MEIDKTINLPFPLPQNTKIIFSDDTKNMYTYIHYLTTPDSWYGIVFNLENKCVLCNEFNCTTHIIKVFEKFDDEIICLFNFYINDSDNEDNEDEEDKDDEDKDDEDDEDNEDEDLSDSEFNLNELENQLVELDTNFDSDEDEKLSSRSRSTSTSTSSLSDISDYNLDIKEIIYSSDPIYNFEYIPLNNVREILTNRDIYEFAYDNDMFHFGFPENENIIPNEDENKLELLHDGEIWMRKLI
jgi:hypothetical protein